MTHLNSTKNFTPSGVFFVHSSCSSSSSWMPAAVNCGVDASATEMTRSLTADNLTVDDYTYTKPWPTLKQPSYVAVILTVAYVIVAVVGVVSNGLVVTLVYKQPRMRTVTNYFLVNLAIADILVCVVVLPITLLQNVYTGMVCVGNSSA